MVEYHITCTSTSYFKSRLYFGKKWTSNKMKWLSLGRFHKYFESNIISQNCIKYDMFWKLITLNKQTHIYQQANSFSLLAILLTFKKITDHYSQQKAYSFYPDENIVNYVQSIKNSIKEISAYIQILFFTLHIAL